MAQTQSAGEPSGPGSDGAGVPDSPQQWGNGGVVGEGRYRLTRRLGRGGMAEVFAAEDVRLGRTVAVKLLRADLAEDPVSKARFTREAQAVAGLNHHAVVAVYDSGEDVVGSDTVPYIVMELVEGNTIRDLLLNSEAPPVDQALIIVSGVLEALAYSHHHGIVHRDIKPANVIITNTGAVKVMDFGIARALHGAQSTMTQTGMVMGTPQYLSPEQALGRAVDARSDLYAVGCLLYELLALRPPFTGETPLSVVYQHVQDDPRVPSEVSDRVPPELDGLVLRALAKEPDDRYQSAEEMRGEVQYALRMLNDVGGNTGAWGTGHVGATPAAGTAAVGAAHGESPVASTMKFNSTAELRPPLLMGPPGGEHPSGASPAGGRGGSPWGKAVLFVVAAVLAVSLGVWFAVSPDDNSGKEPEKDPKPSVTKSEKKDPTEEPSSGTSAPETGDTGSGGWNTNPGGGGGYYSPTPSPSEDTGSAAPPDTSGPTNSGGSTTSGSGGSGGSTGGSTGGSSGETATGETTTGETTGDTTTGTTDGAGGADPAGGADTGGVIDGSTGG
ncbi:protein kinase [Streptomyces sp. NPDC059506]|uniref:protein kinase domain-containing protein n=1 Tax=Streptomyces TaxID=1883 RepID=UPI0015F91592|nr:protein kinase [Streptomyces sp. SCUT-3]QMV22463.1 protein kinase [Streptomyces sp. SCUT-3]